MSNIPIGSATASHLPPDEDFQNGEYFAGANRDIILTHTLEALHRDASLIIWSGENGSGKSTLCKILEDRSSSFCTVVTFPATVDSFEDVIRALVAHLDMDLSVPISRKSVGECQREISLHLQENSVRLLIIFDEAENIYLATLERIRKLIDRFAKEGVNIHVVFAGKPAFLVNCEQLSICDFQYSKEFILRFEPLDLEETGEYLKSLATSNGAAEPGELFSDRLVAEIYKRSGGNFRQVCILGREVLQSPGETVFPQKKQDRVPAVNDVHHEDSGLVSLSRNIKNSVLLPWLGAAGLTAMALLYFTNFIGEERLEQPVVQREQIVDKKPTSARVSEQALAERAAPENGPDSSGTPAGTKEGGAVAEITEPEVRQPETVKAVSVKKKAARDQVAAQVVTPVDSGEQKEEPAAVQPQGPAGVKEVVAGRSPQVVESEKEEPAAVQPQEPAGVKEVVAGRLPQVVEREKEEPAAVQPQEPADVKEVVAGRLPQVVEREKEEPAAVQPQEPAGVKEVVAGRSPQVVQSVKQEPAAVQPQEIPVAEGTFVVQADQEADIAGTRSPAEAGDAVDTALGSGPSGGLQTEREAAEVVELAVEKAGMEPEQTVAIKIPPPQINTAEGDTAEASAGDAGKTAGSATGAEVISAQPVVKLIQPVGKKILEPEKEKIVIERSPVVELYPSGNTKRSPTVEQLQPAETKHKKQIDMVGPDELPEGPLAIDKLYNERLSAGESWRGGGKDGKFTVQLMVLTSRTAENNLKTMLLEDTYRQEADNFFIFKNDSQLETIFVFYGEYPTMTQARQAQNSLPLFLKEHKPYALSIKGAVAKVSR